MKGSICQYVVYQNPIDYPGKFVVRRFFIGNSMVAPELQPFAVTNTLDAARKSIPETHGYMLERLNQDEPQIKEIWMTNALGEQLSDLLAPK